MKSATAVATLLFTGLFSLSTYGQGIALLGAAGGTPAAAAHIAYDNSADLGNNGGGSTSQSGSYTMGSASGGLLLACIAGDNVNGGNDDILTVKYNGVSLTKVGSTGTGGGGSSSARFLYLYYLLGPATGSNTLAVTASHSHYLLLGAGSYTGVQQSAQPDAYSNINIANSSFSGAATPVAINTWGVLCGQYSDAGAEDFDSLVGATRRAVDDTYGTWGFADTNGTLPAGTPWTATFSSAVTGTSTGIMATWIP